MRANSYLLLRQAIYCGIVSRCEEKNLVSSGQNLRFEDRNRTTKFGISALVAVSAIIACCLSGVLTSDPL
jgi:hypothetical protein